MQRVPWRATKVVLGVDRSSYVLSQNKATVMAGTGLYIGLFVSNFLFLFQLIGAINLLLICRKMKYYQCHICSSHSYNSNLPSGPLGPRQIGNYNYFVRFAACDTGRVQSPILKKKEGMQANVTNVNKTFSHPTGLFAGPFGQKWLNDHE